MKRFQILFGLVFSFASVCAVGAGLDEDLAAITREKYPDADVVNALYEETTNYAEDGTYSTRIHTVVKALTDAGRDSLRTRKFHYNAFYGSMTVEVARVQSAAGEWKQLDLSESLGEAVDSSSLSSNIHDPNNKVVSLRFSGIETGGTAECEWVTVASRPRVKGVYADYLTWEDDAPILRSNVSITGPLSRPFKSVRNRDMGPVSLLYSVSTNLTDKTVTWTLSTRNVDRFFAEPEMPPAYDCVARTIASTCESWAELSTWYANLCAPHLAVTNAEMAAKTAELAPADASPEARIRALFDFVSREVRYMGAMAESEAPGYEPHDVALTFTERCGVCRDKAALLVAMLRMAGFDAWPVLINVGPKRDPEVPQPYFNHAIVAVANPDAAAAAAGEPYVLMDPTNESTKSLLPEYLAGKSYLVAREEGDNLRLTPVPPASSNSTDVETRLALAADGSCDGEMTIRVRGYDDVRWRGGLARMARARIQQLLASRVASVVPNAVLLGYEITPRVEDLRRDPSPLVIRATFRSPQAFSETQSGDAYALPLSFAADAFGIASNLAQSYGLISRRFPLRTDITCAGTDKLVISIPEGMRFIAPAAQRYNDGGVVRTLAPSLSDDGRELTIVQTRAFEKDEYSPVDYACLRESAVVDRLINESRVLVCKARPSVKKSSVAELIAQVPVPEPVDDTILRSREIVLDLREAPARWRVETTQAVEILTYGGQKAAADLREYYRPLHEECYFTNAWVKAQDGTVTELDAKLTQFESDANWVAGAPRYDATRIRTLSFPKCVPGTTVGCTIVHEGKDMETFDFAKILAPAGSFDEVKITVLGDNEWTRNIDCTMPRWKGYVANKVEKVGEGASCTWTMKGPGAGHPAPSEGNQPPRSHVAPLVEYTGVTKMEAFRAFEKIAREFSSGAAGEKTRKLGAEIVAGQESSAACVFALREWIWKNMPSRGPAAGEVTPDRLHAADDTLAAGYGHNPDIAIFSMALAEGAGFTARLRCVDAGNTGDSYVTGKSPQHGGFGKWVVELDGKWVLDQSSVYAPVDADITRGDAHASSSGWNPGPKFDYQNRTVREYTMEFQPDASALVTICTKSYGANFESAHRTWTEMVSEEQTRHVNERVAAFAQGAKLVKHTCGGDVYGNDPAWEDVLVLRMPPLPVTADGHVVVSLPGGVLPLGPEIAPRTMPFRRSMRSLDLNEWTISYPAQWRLEASPEIDKFKSGGASWQFYGRDIRGKWVGSARREVAPAEFAADDYSSYVFETLKSRTSSASALVFKTK